MTMANLGSKIKSAVTKAAAKVATTVAKVVTNNNKNSNSNTKTTSNTTSNNKTSAQSWAWSVAGITSTPKVTLNTKTTTPTIKTISNNNTVSNALSQSKVVPSAIQSQINAKSQNAVLTNPTTKTTTTTKTSSGGSSGSSNTSSNRTAAVNNLAATSAALRTAAATKTASGWSTASNSGSSWSTWTWGTTAAKVNAALKSATSGILSKTPLWQAVTAVLNATKAGTNRTWQLSAWTGSTQFDHTQQNVNGSPKVKETADSILYDDGSIYDKKTWVTKDKNWIVMKDTNQAKQTTESDARWVAESKSNNFSAWNSSTYNPTAATKNVTQTQAAANTIVNQNNEVKTKTLWSQEKAYKNDDWSITYIAPNGKKYIIAKGEDGSIMFNSQGWETKWSWVNLQNDDWSINNNAQDVVKYIKENNQIDWIDRGNVDNSRAIGWATIEWTYTAPSGKEYDIVEWQGAHAGQVWFVNVKGQVEYFDSWDAAKSKIDQNNPVGSTDTGKNQIAPELEQRWYIDENGNFITGIDSLDKSNFDLEADRSEREQALQDTIDELREENRRLKDESEETYNRKNAIVESMFWDIEAYQREMEDALGDLKEKTQLVQDNDRMRRARQRAAQLAAQWYLTSEQVAQVANYSLADYNKELEAAAAEAAQKLSEMRTQILDKKEQYIQAIRQTQYNNESDRQSQINYINNVCNTLLQWYENTAWAYDQYYTTLRQNNLALNTQNELWYDSLIRQNDVQNVINDKQILNALSNTTDRRKYILSQVSDVNLHPYVEQIMNYLQSQWKFLIRSWSTEQMKNDLMTQISGIISAAKQAQIQDQKSLAS